MPKNIENAVQTGAMDFNGQRIDVFQVEPDFPCSPEKRAQCIEHLEEGRGDELYSDFLMFGCDFPVAIEEGKITVGLACRGLSMFTKHCRLTLTQYDEGGKVLNEGKFE